MDKVKSMVLVDLCPMFNTGLGIAISVFRSESKYLAISPPSSEAVSASIHMIHSRSCIWGGGGTIIAGLTSAVLLHDIVCIYMFVVSIQYYAQIFAKLLSIGGGRKFNLHWGGGGGGGGLTCITISYQAHSSKRVNYWAQILGGGGGGGFSPKALWAPPHMLSKVHNLCVST